MAKMSGWQKVGLFAGAGCLSIVGIIAIGLIVAVGRARSIVSELGDTTPSRVERTVALTPAPAADGAATPAPVDPTQPLQLTIDLQEGNFTIRPGAAGEPVRVEGTFAPGIYELTENHDAAARRTTIRFRSKAPQWARILAGMGDGDMNRPELTVVIPAGTPMDLTLRLSMGESEIDLGGLALRDLDLDVSMGEHRIDFPSPADEAVRRVRVNASMGNVRVERLGNARPLSIEGTGSMGNLTADLGGEWEAGVATEMSFSQSMGELTVRVPRSVKLDADVEQGDQANRTTVDTTDQTDDPNAPTIKLRVRSSMGESRVVRY